MLSLRSSDIDRLEWRAHLVEKEREVREAAKREMSKKAKRRKGEACGNRK